MHLLDVFESRGGTGPLVKSELAGGISGVDGLRSTTLQTVEASETGQV